MTGVMQDVGTHRTGVVVLAVVGLLVLGSCTAGRATSARRDSAPTPRASSPSATTSSPALATPPTTAPITSPGAWPSRTVLAAGTGTVADLNPTTDAVYALDEGTVHSASGIPSSVIRYDVRTGRALFGASIDDPGAMTFTGGWIWVVTIAATEHAVVVDRVDPGTLAVAAQTQLAIVPLNTGDLGEGTLTATAGGPLWIAAGSTVYALSPTTGAILTKVDAEMDVSSMATSPDGTTLYVVGQRSNLPIVLSEFDARSGRVLATEGETDGIGDDTVAATDEGVWLSYRTGMNGVTVLHDKARLATVSTQPASAFPSPFDQTMGETTNVSDGVLWLTGVQGLACADPVTGALRATEPPVPSQIDSVVADDGVLYGAGLGGLSVLTAPGACFS